MHCSFPFRPLQGEEGSLRTYFARFAPIRLEEASGAWASPGGARQAAAHCCPDCREGKVASPRLGPAAPLPLSRPHHDSNPSLPVSPLAKAHTRSRSSKAACPLPFPLLRSLYPSPSSASEDKRKMSMHLPLAHFFFFPVRCLFLRWPECAKRSGTGSLRLEVWMPRKIAVFAAASIPS